MKETTDINIFETFYFFLNDIPKRNIFHTPSYNVTRPSKDHFALEKRFSGGEEGSFLLENSVTAVTEFCRLGKFLMRISKRLGKTLDIF